MEIMEDCNAGTQRLQSLKWGGNGNGLEELKILILPLAALFKGTCSLGALQGSATLASICLEDKTRFSFSGFQMGKHASASR